jgi:serine/threonine protein kinase
MAAMMGPEIEIVGESSIKVKNIKELQDALKDPATSANAKELLQDMVAVLRSPNRGEALKSIRQNYPEMTMKDILELTVTLQSVYQAEYSDLSHRFKEAVNDRRAVTFADTEISPFQRELLKLIIHEAKTTNQLLSGVNEAGKAKSPAEKNADLAKLKEKIAKGEIGLGELNLQVLTGSDAGSEILNSLITNPDVAKKIIASPDGITFIREQIRDGNLNGYHKMPKEIQEALRNDTIQGFKDKLNSIENEDIRKSLLLKYSDAELAKLFSKLETDPKFAEQKDLPSLMSLLVANHENLTLDYFQKILTGNVEYKDVQTYENGVLKNKKILVVGSDNQLGEGSFGKVRSQLIIDSKEPKYHESAVKTPHVSLAALSYYEQLPPGKKAIVDKAFASDLLDLETYRTQKAILIATFSERSSVLEAFTKHLDNIRSRPLEARNNLLIAKYQSMGKLKGLMRIDYVAVDGSLTVMENMYDPKQGCVPTLKEMLEGKVSIPPEQFGNFLADAIDTLQEMHDLGLLHHDVKPDNIAIGPDGKIRFLDFGSVMNTEDLMNTKYEADRTPSEIEMMFEMARNGSKYVEMLLGTNGFNVTPEYYDYTVGYNEGHGKVPFGMSDNEAIIRIFTYDLIGEENPYKEYKPLKPNQVEAAKRLVPPAKLEILKPYIQQYHDGKIDSKTFSGIIRKTLTKPK